MSGLLLLVLATAWLAIAIWISGLLARKVMLRPQRAALRLFSLALLVSLPLWDEMIGIWQFRHLCSDGARLVIDEQRIRGKSVRLTIEPSWAAVPNTAIPIRYSKYSYRDVETNEELASYKDFDAKGGRLIRTLRLLEGDPPLLLGNSWCGPPDREDFPTSYSFTLVN